MCRAHMAAETSRQYLMPQGKEREGPTNMPDQCAPGLESHSRMICISYFSRSLHGMRSRSACDRCWVFQPRHSSSSMAIRKPRSLSRTASWIKWFGIAWSRSNRVCSRGGGRRESPPRRNSASVAGARGVGGPAILEKASHSCHARATKPGNNGVILRDASRRDDGDENSLSCPSTGAGSYGGRGGEIILRRWFSGCASFPPRL